MTRREGGRRRAPWPVRLLLAVQPPGFRRRFREDFLDAYVVERERRRATGGPSSAVVFATRTVGGLLVGLPGQWWAQLRGRARMEGPSGRKRARRLEPWLLEIRLLLRGLVRSPAFTLAVVVTLGLGIGANTAMFALVDRLLLRPPYGLEEPHAVHRLYQSRVTSRGRTEQSAFSSAALLDLRRGGADVEAVVGNGLSRQIVKVGDRPLPVWVMGLSGDYWSLFDVAPVTGRFFGPPDDRLPRGEDVAVLAYDFWRDVFGSDPGAIGRTLRIGDRTFTVIGVAPRGFRGLELWDTAMFVPLSSLASIHLGPDFIERPFTTWLSLFARTRPGGSDIAAQELTAAFEAHYTRVRDAAFARKLDPRIMLGPVLWNRGPFGDDAAHLSLWLLGTSAVVLLVAVANAATLLLGRALRRRRELAVRSALGMSAGRMLLLPAIESLVLALIAALLAVPLGALLVQRVSTMLLPELLGATERLGPRAYGFTMAITTLSGLVAGWTASVRLRAADLGRALRAAAAGAGRSKSRLQSALPALQAALSAVLLVGAGLFVRSLVEASAVHLGFDADHVAVVDLEEAGAFSDYAEGGEPIRRMESLRDLARSLPDVRAAALSTAVPFVDRAFTSVYPESGAEPTLEGGVGAALVDWDYFSAVGTAIVRGRGFEKADQGGSEPVAVVSASMAARLWPAGDALGACFRPRADTLPCHRIVGVAEDVRDGDLREDAAIRFYVPRGQLEERYAGALVLRFARPAEGKVELVRRQLQPSLPAGVYARVRPMRWIVGEELRRWRAGAEVLSLFGLLALVIAGFGTFSVIAYQVSERRREFGVRIALGASGQDLIALILRRAVGGVAVGVLLGLAAAWALAGLVEGFLFGVGSRDPVTFALVAVILLGSAGAASFSPALRASAAEPRDVLNSE